MLLVNVSSAATPPPAHVFDACEAMVREHPGDEASYRCFYVKALGAGRLAEASERLERISRRAGHDANWARLFLALLASAAGQPRAERLFEEAATAFSANANPRGAVLARIGLARFFRIRARLDDAERQVAAAEQLVVAAADRVLAARVSVASTPTRDASSARSGGSSAGRGPRRHRTSTRSTRCRTPRGSRTGSVSRRSLPSKRRAGRARGAAPTRARSGS